MFDRHRPDVSAEVYLLALYLFCFALGGGFLLLSVLGGDGGDTDLDLDADIAGDIDASHETAATRIFSVRTLIYGLFGFGATGAALSALGSGLVSTLLFALAGGALSGLLVGSVFRYLGATDSGSAPTDASLIGLTGRVVLPLSHDLAGSIAVVRGARRTTLRALPHGSATEGDPASWRAVVVVDVEDGIVRVAPLDAEDQDLLPPAQNSV